MGVDYSVWGRHPELLERTKHWLAVTAGGEGGKGGEEGFTLPGLLAVLNAVRYCRVLTRLPVYDSGASAISATGATGVATTATPGPSTTATTCATSASTLMARRLENLLIAASNRWMVVLLGLDRGSSPAPAKDWELLVDALTDLRLLDKMSPDALRRALWGQQQGRRGITDAKQSSGNEDDGRSAEVDVLPTTEDASGTASTSPLPSPSSSSSSLSSSVEDELLRLEGQHWQLHPDSSDTATVTPAVVLVLPSESVPPSTIEPHVTPVPPVQTPGTSPMLTTHSSSVVRDGSKEKDIDKDHPGALRGSRKEAMRFLQVLAATAATTTTTATTTTSAAATSVPPFRQRLALAPEGGAVWKGLDENVRERVIDAVRTVLRHDSAVTGPGPGQGQGHEAVGGGSVSYPQQILSLLHQVGQIR